MSAIPDDLVARSIQVTIWKGATWVAMVLKIIHRDGDFILVRESGRGLTG